MKLSQPNQRVRRTSGYLPELDVVRLIAFFAVFLHHLPGHASLYATTARAYGWAGVDLFFVLSSYLFFSMLDREYALTGSINVRNFFIRRVMRIYPLMIAFPIMMLVIYG
ncbi:MAG: acyltransferase family protein, partial [Rhizobiaceae bacterium]